MIVNDVKKDVEHFVTNLRKNHREKVLVRHEEKNEPYEEDKVLLGELFNYLKKHREISLNGITRDLQLSIPNVEKVLTELDKLGKIKLH